MQDTGIVRRVDELGRVVIPKELRRTLRIREGDPLEIYTNKEELILKKYSPVTSLEEIAKGVCSQLGEITEKSVIITDMDTVVCVSDSKHKEYIGKTISEELLKVISGRRSVMGAKGDGGKIYSLFKGDEINAENQILVPITAMGDCYGSVIMFDEDKTNRFSSQDTKLVSLSAGVIAKNFQD